MLEASTPAGITTLFKGLPRSHMAAVCFSLFSLLLFLVKMHGAWYGAIADDGAFFLKYAQNMANGYFWIWNPGEAPVWGASAPLYPLYIAAIIKLGFTPLDAIVSGGSALGALALSATSGLLVRRFGYIAGILFVAFAVCDSHFIWFLSTAGLESPLTIAFLTAGLFALSANNNAWYVGIAAGLLAIDKIDQIPVAFWLLCAFSFKAGRIQYRAVGIAAAISVVWYGFAWCWFGLPIPNSFITKSLFQNQPAIIDWRWFGRFVLYENYHIVLSGLALVSILLKRRVAAPVHIYLLGLIITHLVAYTLKHPLEPYNWYAMPSIYGLLVVAAVGAQALWEKCRTHGYTAALLFLVASLYLIFHVKEHGEFLSAAIKQYLYLEKDRMQAGKWVDEHTPKDFRVYTYFGGPAFYSQRYVYDASFLNRPYEKENMVAKYRPEIIVARTNRESDDYTLVKVFASARQEGIDFAFGVHVRNDVLNKVTDKDERLKACSGDDSCGALDTPLIKQALAPQLGDNFGVIRAAGKGGAIFVHPGEKTPSSFELSPTALTKSHMPTATLVVSISDNVPSDAVARGAASVGIEVTRGGTRYHEREVVTLGRPISIVLDTSPGPNYKVVVDNNGNPDTDWTIIRQLPAD
ncbi:hypothetical protein [Pseudomonas massiliensis]|uniref:hypothetical protein n=1 Tax=Pseudomonas massiliensis TaxID=522492 RepID=UPI00058EAD73|nr:hypothetical protein [Pseudomonas massiliensis]